MVIGGLWLVILNTPSDTVSGSQAHAESIGTQTHDQFDVLKTFGLMTFHTVKNMAKNNRPQPTALDLFGAMIFLIINTTIIGIKGYIYGCPQQYNLITWLISVFHYVIDIKILNIVHMCHILWMDILFIYISDGSFVDICSFPDLVWCMWLYLTQKLFLLRRSFCTLLKTHPL